MTSHMGSKTTDTRLKPGLTAGLVAVFIFLLAAFYCRLAQGADLANPIEFGNTVPLPGSVQWMVNQQTNAQRQESYRKRVAIPDAVSTFVPRSAAANLMNGRPVIPDHVSAEARANAVAPFVDLLFFAASLALVAGLVLRRIAPQVLTELNQLCNPWAEPPAGDRDMAGSARAEEKPFGEFLAALRAGPVSPALTAATEAEDPHREFYAQTKKRLATQRKLVQALRRETGDAGRKKSLVELYFELGVLKDAAGFPEVLPVWQVASAMEGLLKELTGRIRSATASTLRTVEGGLDLLDRLCVPGAKPGLLTGRPFKFLVVDDDLISRQALALSLKKSFSEPDVAVDGAGALIHAGRQAYDVIFLDVQMPGMDGFELCQKIHTLDLNRATPVVFVTSDSDFDARATSTLVGGNDLMGKPFLIFEITVKALTLALLGRLTADAVSAPATVTLPAERVSGVPEIPVSVPASPRFASPPVRRRPAATAYSEMNAATRAFVNRAIQHVGALRELSESMLRTTDTSKRQNLLADGFLRLNSLVPKNPADVMHPACPLCIALEGLIRKLLEDATHTTPSALATITSAVELLDDLCAPDVKTDLDLNPPIRLLVVDDDLVARRALAGALQTVFEKPESVESGEAAVALARVEPFDVCFLDLQMPGMDGFETCTKIRETECNRETSVVFVTGHSDFAARAETSRQGGNDLVAKPFLTAEINVKALTFALRGRLQRLKQTESAACASVA